MNLRAAALLAASVLAWPALAQNFPTRPITIVVPASPGGAIDITARLIGAKLSAAWGQPVNIDNRAGATGTTGTDFVAKAAPDGHVLALVASSHAINPSMFRKLPYDTVKSFEPVMLTHVVPLMLVVSPALPVKTVPELIAYGKGNPGKLSFASSGNGGAPHMSGELFKSMTGTFMVHIPYRGSGPALIDLMGGSMDVMFDNLPSALPHIKSGRLKALAVTSAVRSSALPDLPTVAEAGGSVLKGYEASSWFGLLAPAGTPADVIGRVQAEVARSLAAPAIKERLVAQGAIPSGNTPAEFARFIDAETRKWAGVVKASGARVD